MERIDIDVESDVEGTSKAVPRFGDKRKSPYWDHYKETRDPKTGKILTATCIYCSKVLAGNTDNGTSSLKKHLNACRLYPLNVDKKQRLISMFKSANSESVTMKTWDGFNQDAVRLALAKMIVMDEEPFNRVERAGFRYFMSVACPQFLIPSRFTVARDINKIYICEKAQLASCFASLKSRVALTTDCWTSNQNLSYLCLTAHFIDENWKLHKRIINFKVIDSHKGNEIGKVVLACVNSWGLQDKLSCLTVDNASSNDSAIKYLKDSMGSKLMFNGEFFHMRCAAHVLNLIVRDGLDMVKSALLNIRSAIRYVRSSPSRLKIFDQCAKSKQISYKGGVCLDVCTRWNSTYLMLEHALEYKTVFDQLVLDCPEYKADMEALPVDKGGLPTAGDWVNAQLLTVFLKKFYESTKRMSGTLYTTSNMHFNEIVQILTSLIRWERDPSTGLGEMSKKMRDKFNKYYGEWGKTNLMVLLGIVFDPRYKLRYVKAALNRVACDGTDVNELCDETLYNVLKRLCDFYSTTCAHLRNVPVMPSATDVHPSTGSSTLDVEDDVLIQILEDFHSAEAVVDVVRIPELDLYLQGPSVKEENFNILSWWQMNSSTYPVLAAVARDILAVPISTVSSESAFSTSGRVLDQFRSSLGPKTVETLICTQDWLRGAEVCMDLEEMLDEVEQYEEDCASGITQVDNMDEN